MNYDVFVSMLLSYTTDSNSYWSQIDLKGPGVVGSQATKKLMQASWKVGGFLEGPRGEVWVI
jgi:hypothetical protein